jgi:hypothetical protein
MIHPSNRKDSPAMNEDDSIAGLEKVPAFSHEIKLW